jgi:hypothetical protein
MAAGQQHGLEDWGQNWIAVRMEQTVFMSSKEKVLPGVSERTIGDKSTLFDSRKVPALAWARSGVLGLSHAAWPNSQSLSTEKYRRDF